MKKLSKFHGLRSRYLSYSNNLMTQREGPWVKKQMLESSDSAMRIENSKDVIAFRRWNFEGGNYCG